MADKKFFSRDDVKGVSDIKIEPLHIPEWDTPEAEAWVYLRTLSGGERDSFESQIVSVSSDGVQSANLNNARAKFAVLILCDETGKRLFNSADIPWLTQKNAGALNRIWAKGRTMTGMDEQAVEEATDELKNDPAADLPTG